jgi:hypothetical protein
VTGLGKNKKKIGRAFYLGYKYFNLFFSYLKITEADQKFWATFFQILSLFG